MKPHALLIGLAFTAVVSFASPASGETRPGVLPAMSHASQAPSAFERAIARTWAGEPVQVSAAPDAQVSAANTASAWRGAWDAIRERQEARYEAAANELLSARAPRRWR